MNEQKHGQSEKKARTRDETETKEKVWYGEKRCGHEHCTNGAYYSLLHNGKWVYLCGVHSRKRKSERKELPKMSKRQKTERVEAKKRAHNATVEAARQSNAAQNRPGMVQLFRMRMLKLVGFLLGVLNIFPNRRHATRADGWGCPELSPMLLGPLALGRLGKSIENFHQLVSKCYACECVPIRVEAGERPIVLEDYPGSTRPKIEVRMRPGPIYYENRKAGIANPEPQRHKFPQEPKGKTKKKSSESDEKVGEKASHETKEDASVNPNIPLMFVWIDEKDGTEHYLTYIASRQFYCTYYARMVAEQPRFKEITEMIRRGTNVRICGYDAEPIEIHKGETAAQAAEREYLNWKTPFGHERVLWTMWTLPPEEWPWAKYKTFDF